MITLQRRGEIDASLFIVVDAEFGCDTSGALAGAPARALLGDQQIADRWLEEMEFRDEPSRLADHLFELTLALQHRH